MLSFGESKGLVFTRAKVAWTAGAYPCFHSTKRLEVILLLGVSITGFSPGSFFVRLPWQFSGTHFTPWWRDALWEWSVEKCLAQEYNTETPTRANKQTIRSYTLLEKKRIKIWDISDTFTIVSSKREGSRRGALMVSVLDGFRSR